MAAQQGQQAAFAAARRLPMRYEVRKVGPVIQEPLEALVKTGQFFQELRFQSLDGEQRNQAHHGPKPHADAFIVRRLSTS